MGQVELQRLDARLGAVVEEIGAIRRALAAETVIKQRRRPPPLRPVAEGLRGTRWMDQAARASAGILVRAAAARQKLTYTELHAEVSGAGGKDDIGTPLKYARALDRLAQALAAVSAPPLTIAVIAKKTGAPGAGVNRHLATWLRAQGRPEDAAAVKRAGGDAPPAEMVALAWAAVVAFTDWGDVLERLGLSGVPSVDLTRAM